MRFFDSCSWKLFFTILIGGAVIIATCIGLVMLLEGVFNPQTRLLDFSLAGVFALPLCILLLVLGIQGWKHAGQLKPKNGVEILGGLLLIVAIIFSFKSSTAYNQAQEPFRKLASPACSGTAGPAAAPYQANDSFHPILFLNEKGESAGSYLDTAYIWQWQSARPGELQLVACIEEKRAGLETCHYSGGGAVSRYQKMVHIRVMSIYSGMLVAEKEFYGSTPSTCPETTNNSGGEYVGGPVSNNEVRAWLAQYVNPPQE